MATKLVNNTSKNDLDHMDKLNRIRNRGSDCVIKAQEALNEMKNIIAGAEGDIGHDDRALGLAYVQANAIKKSANDLMNVTKEMILRETDERELTTKWFKVVVEQTEDSERVNTRKLKELDPAVFDALIKKYPQSIKGKLKVSVKAKR